MLGRSLCIRQLHDVRQRPVVLLAGVPVRLEGDPVRRHTSGILGTKHRGGLPPPLQGRGARMRVVHVRRDRQRLPDLQDVRVDLRPQLRVRPEGLLAQRPARYAPPHLHTGTWTSSRRHLKGAVSPRRAPEASRGTFLIDIQVLGS